MDIVDRPSRWTGGCFSEHAARFCVVDSGVRRHSGRSSVFEAVREIVTHTQHGKRAARAGFCELRG